VDDADRRLQADAADERRARRQRRGFVADADAVAFLAGIRAASLDALIAMNAYDAATALQLRAAAAAPTVERTAEEDEAEAPDLEITDADIDRLQATLEGAEVIASRGQHRLTGPATTPRESLVQSALAGLQDEPETFETRMRELAYLANALIAGTQHSGAPFGEEAAARAVTATCDLGLASMLWRIPDGHPAALITDEPGLIRAFAVGHSVLSRLPIAVADRLAELIERPGVRLRIGAKPWVLLEADALVKSGALRAAVLARTFDDAKETISLLQIVLEPHACTALRALVDDYPAFPLVLEQASNADKVLTGTRFIDSLEDLAAIDRLLKSLERWVRL